MLWKDILHICLSWLAAVEHGKIEENIVNTDFMAKMGIAMLLPGNIVKTL